MTMRKYISLVALCLTLTPVHAGEITDLQAESIDIGDFHGIVFYTGENDGYRVVATIAQGETGLPVRFEATLIEAQKITITVPGKLGEISQAIELTRVGSKLVVGRQTSGNELKVAEPQATRP
jgi:hypothetical protein